MQLSEGHGILAVREFCRYLHTTTHSGSLSITAIVMREMQTSLSALL